MTIIKTTFTEEDIANYLKKLDSKPNEKKERVLSNIYHDYISGTYSFVITQHLISKTLQKEPKHTSMKRLVEKIQNSFKELKSLYTQPTDKRDKEKETASTHNFFIQISAMPRIQRYTAVLKNSKNEELKARAKTIESLANDILYGLNNIFSQKSDGSVFYPNEDLKKYILQKELQELDDIIISSSGFNPKFYNEKGKFLRIEYEDNGKGVLKENEEKIFQRGYTTKEKKEGHGQGLANIKETIEKDYNGTIKKIDSETGLKLEIIIPLAREDNNLVIK